jgi:hypothetical protein
MQEKLLKVLSGFGRVVVLVGRINFDLFRSTSEYGKAKKFSWPGQPQIFSREYRGCLAYKKGQILKVVLWVHHSESSFYQKRKGILGMVNN